MKKEATPQCKGLKPKTSDEKEATPKRKEPKQNTPDTNQKIEK
jgi:hypothetical protein